MAQTLNNKYSKWYFSLVQKRQAEPLSKLTQYCEEHHIDPKSLGGSNKKENLVLFSAREHFIAHLLLTKMYEGDAKRKMHYAFYSMRRGKRNMNRYSPNSHVYAILTKNIKREVTAETRAKMSASQRSRPQRTTAQLKNLSEGVKASYTSELRALRSSSQKGIPKSAETKRRMSENGKGKNMPESHRESARLRRGEKSPRSKTWVIQSPDGLRYTTKACGDFCKEHGISYFALRNKATAKDQTPVNRGSTKGWAVLSSS